MEVPPHHPLLDGIFYHKPSSYGGTPFTEPPKYIYIYIYILFCHPWIFPFHSFRCFRCPSQTSARSRHLRGMQFVPRGRRCCRHRSPFLVGRSGVSQPQMVSAGYGNIIIIMIHQRKPALLRVRQIRMIQNDITR